MTNTKTTKRALLLSLLSLLICFSMLIGSTFAWFTDKATTGVNKIQSGTLDVGLQMLEGENWVDAEGKTLTFKTADGRDAEDILWEPGCTYQLPELRVVNYGNLNLKYTLVITGLKGDAPLNEVIVWTYTMGDKTLDTTSFVGTLAPGSKANPNPSETILIEGHMMEEAGNEYMGMTISNISVTVYATQNTVENDSFGPNYDAGAVNPYASVFAQGGDIAVTAPVIVSSESADAASIIKSDANVNFGDNTILLNLPNATGSTANWKGLDIQAGNVVLDGEAGGVSTAANVELYAIMVGNKAANTSADVTINGGNYIGGTTSVQVSLGTLTINGGFFQAQDNNQTYVLNCLDANYKNGTANIVVKGGTFVNFDPSNNAAEGEGTNFVAEGYKVVAKEQANGDVWYEVVEASTVEATPGTVEELKSLIEEAMKGKTDIIINIDQDFDVEGNWEAFNAGAYNGVVDVTINGNNHTIFGLNAPLFTSAFAGTGVLTFNDLTIEDANISASQSTINNNSLGLGAFVGYINSNGGAVFNNCHLVNSYVECTDGYAGGFIGYADKPLVIKHSSVSNSTIKGASSTGAYVGHSYTTTVENCTVTGNTTVTSSSTSSWRTGALIGTVNATAEFKGVSVDNTVTVSQPESSGTAIHKLYGRNAGTSVTLDGNAI